MIFQKLMLGISAVAMTATPAMAHSTGGKGHEPILTRPISDIPDDYWYDYLADIREAGWTRYHRRIAVAPVIRR